MLCLFERYDFITDIKRATNSIKIYSITIITTIIDAQLPHQRSNRTRTEQCRRSEKKREKKKARCTITSF